MSNLYIAALEDWKATADIVITSFTHRYKSTIPAAGTVFANLFQIKIPEGKKWIFSVAIWFSPGSAGQVHVKIIKGVNVQVGESLIPLNKEGDYIGDDNTCYGLTPRELVGGETISFIGYNTDPVVARDVTWELQISEKVG